MAENTAWLGRHGLEVLRAAERALAQNCGAGCGDGAGRDCGYASHPVAMFGHIAMSFLRGTVAAVSVPLCPRRESPVPKRRLTVNGARF